MIKFKVKVLLAMREMTQKELAERTGKGGHHPGEPVDFKKQQGQGGTLLHTGGHLCRFGLPAWGFA